MKLQSLSLLTVSGLLLVLAGCASDPNKQVQSSEANLTSEQRQAQMDQAELDRKQAEERAKKAELGPPKQAELDRKQESEQADTRTSSAKDISGANKDVVDAYANMAQERRDLDAKVEERIDKADAKEKELTVKSKKLDPKKTTAFRSNQTRFMDLRADVRAKARAIKGTNNDGWAAAKRDLEKQLDAMESMLDQMGKGL